MAPQTLIPLGKVVNVHATRGELRMLPFNPGSDTLTRGGTVVLRRGDAQEERRLRAVRRHKRFLLLTLDDCESMTAAEQLVGCEVCVREHDLPPAGPGEIYHYQLVGMAVVTTGGRDLGIVVEVLDTVSNAVCVVRAADKEYLIPMVAAIVKVVDRDARRLIIEPLPGLLDDE